MRNYKYDGIRNGDWVFTDTCPDCGAGRLNCLKQVPAMSRCVGYPALGECIYPARSFWTDWIHRLSVYGLLVFELCGVKFCFERLVTRCGSAKIWQMYCTIKSFSSTIQIRIDSWQRVMVGVLEKNPPCSRHMQATKE
jgi:hypothetical protein